MLFTSFGFILFLAILFPLYYLVPKRFQWMLLLAASCAALVAQSYNPFLYFRF